MNPKEAAKALLFKARDARVRFPRVWDESVATQNCGAALVCAIKYARWSLLMPALQQMCVGNRNFALLLLYEISS